MSSNPKQEQQDASKLDTTPSFTDNPESQITADINKSEPACDSQPTTTEPREERMFMSFDTPCSLSVKRHEDPEEEAL
ncbi:hypothetical protein CBS63078_2082 [Aspergillus niger]|uniref:Uncharacterized protein n=1 Tax=Aspergillus niger ATCC 13496 TaxID=1353008 RepID=A0A370C0L9_ASPNG|nr:hypothetical protein CBS115989_1697 [Aspergillus niger]RDH20278.1 hypothetical protein M747DRAFT_295862 [Aspergillus niger ATCC 13496]KAI2825328.1 hypothetical protein CBS133816_8572 [Aspergillus niger]KAI2838375.1 hypothetical protein CBS12448_10861 [Aspergillus niger]KAI2852869.1 hypothetical protein CBS11350_502 [Aspergillus niger]